MKINILLLAILSFLNISCSIKTKPKLCKVVIKEPSKEELLKFKNKNMEKPWQKKE